MYPIKYIILTILFIGCAFSLVANAGLIVPMPVQVDVSPASGAIYLDDVNLFKEASFYNYTYKINFKDFASTDIPKRFLLQIFNESEKKWNPGIVIENKNQDAIVEREINIEKEVGGEFLGKVQYRIVSDPNASDLYSSTGPEITVNFRHEKFKKTGTNKYDCSVEVKSSLDRVNVYLYEKNLIDGSWEYLPDYQTYKNTKVNGTNANEWIPISWNNITGYNMVEFAV
jgi:hypothetical protein